MTNRSMTLPLLALLCATLASLASYSARVRWGLWSLAPVPAHPAPEPIPLTLASVHRVAFNGQEVPFTIEGPDRILARLGGELVEIRLLPTGHIAAEKP